MGKPAPVRQKSLLTYAEYAEWCVSRFPAFDPGEEKRATAATMAPSDEDEACPSTVRSEPGDRIVVTPRPRGSR